jgi:hypothetical protein
MATVSWRLFMIPHIWKLICLELARSSHNLSRILSIASWLPTHWTLKLGVHILRYPQPVHQIDFSLNLLLVLHGATQKPLISSLP